MSLVASVLVDCLPPVTMHFKNKNIEMFAYRKQSILCSTSNKYTIREGKALITDGNRDW
jgi:hypothetical protein